MASLSTPLLTSLSARHPPPAAGQQRPSWQQGQQRHQHACAACTASGSASADSAPAPYACHGPGAAGQDRGKRALACTHLPFMRAKPLLRPVINATDSSASMFTHCLQTAAGTRGDTESDGEVAVREGRRDKGQARQGCLLQRVHRCWQAEDEARKGRPHPRCSHRSSGSPCPPRKQRTEKGGKGGGREPGGRPAKLRAARPYQASCACHSAGSGTGRGGHNRHKEGGGGGRLGCCGGMQAMPLCSGCTLTGLQDPLTRP